MNNTSSPEITPSSHPSRRNLILAGFMGVGKTTVGKLCAQALGWTFLDTDVEIERREGINIPQIFARHGEAYFRARETELAREIAGRKNLVVATGGGMIVNAENRAILLQTGLCVNLIATPEDVLKRLGPEAAARRPMLQGGRAEERIAQLLKERAPAYAELHYHVGTTALTPERIAQRVTQLFESEQWRIAVAHPSGQYDLVMGDGVFSQLGRMLAARNSAAPIAIVADDNTGRLYGEPLAQALREAGLRVVLHCMPAGEAHKHLGSVEAMYRAFAENGLERTSAVIALGGGVVGDVAGFAAATYLRGVPFVQVPTSLLAMADSSIGGKVGVDTPFGKNLVGAFKQPELVVIDLACLQTLPAIEMQCGLAEIIKGGLIRGGEAWERIRQIYLAGATSGTTASASPWSDVRTVQTILTDAILLKRDVVEEDPFEKGRRALLNLGHTFGHGLEAWSRFAIRHGEAVSLGMVCALRASHQLGHCTQALVDEGVAVLDQVGLPTHLSRYPQLAAHYDVDAVWHIMQSDKKKAGGNLRFILIREPGACFISNEVDEGRAKDVLRSLREGASRQ